MKLNLIHTLTVNRSQMEELLRGNAYESELVRKSIAKRLRKETYQLPILPNLDGNFENEKPVFIPFYNDSFENLNITNIRLHNCQVHVEYNVNIEYSKAFKMMVETCDAIKMCMGVNNDHP